ncbi:hypothetical protein [Myxosarcina sp. GI1(2024)]
MLSQLNSWNRWNQLLVSLSILVFLPLQFPQVLRNHELIVSGDPEAIAALTVIPAMGYASGMLGNLLLMNFLAERLEFWGTAVQAVGMITSGIVLIQLFSAGLVPVFFFIPFVAILIVGSVFNYSNFFLNKQPLWSEHIWLIGRLCMRIMGIALLPAFAVLQLHDALFPKLPQWPGGIGIALLASFLVLTFIRQQAETFPEFFAEKNSWRRQVLNSSEWLDAWLRRGWQGLAGWTANLLFMFGPLAQLINSIIHPDSLSALSLTTQFLCVGGNLLMLSRSGTLLVQGKDRIWCFSSLWDIAMRMGVFFCVMYYHLLAPVTFFTCLALVFGCLGFIYLMAKRECQEASISKTFEFLLFGRWQEVTNA